jgi:hypothetical protein
MKSRWSAPCWPTTWKTIPTSSPWSAASAALVISGAPFMGPIGAARVGYVNGEYILNPTLDEMKESAMDLVVAGTNEAVMMVESEIQELSEDEVLKARHVRPRRHPAGDRRDHRTGRALRQGAASTSPPTTPTPSRPT